MSNPGNRGKGESRNSVFSGELSRRKFLKMLGYGTGAAFLGSLTGHEFLRYVRNNEVVPAASPSSPTGKVHDTSSMSVTSVDISDGENAFDYVKNVSSGELLEFPSGTFRWEGTTTIRSQDNWGIRAQPDTTFMVPEGVGDQEKYEMLNVKNGRNILLENLTFDSTGRTAAGIRFTPADAGHIKNLHYKFDGLGKLGNIENGMSAGARDPDGEIVIENYRQLNWGDIGGYDSGNTRVGMYGAAANSGLIRVVNPVLQGFPNNALYVSRSGGDVRVEGGYLFNNNVSAVRASGGVEVHGTTIEIDTDRYVSNGGEIGDAGHNTRGIWADARSDRAEAGGLAKNVSFILRSYQRCTGLIPNGLDNPYIEAEDCQFLVNADNNRVINGSSGEVRIRTSNFSGDADGSTMGQGDVTGRDNCVADNLEPGEVPVSSRSGCGFDWSIVHPEAGGDGDVPGGGGNTPSEFTISLSGGSAGSRLNYMFEVDGSVSKSDTGERTDIYGSTVTGAVGENTDTYTVDGSITDFRADEGVEISIDGSRVSRSEFLNNHWACNL